MTAYSFALRPHRPLCIWVCSDWSGGPSVKLSTDYCANKGATLCVIRPDRAQRAEAKSCAHSSSLGCMGTDESLSFCHVVWYRYAAVPLVIERLLRSIMVVCPQTHPPGPLVLHIPSGNSSRSSLGRPCTELRSRRACLSTAPGLCVLSARLRRPRGQGPDGAPLRSCVCVCVCSGWRLL